LVESRRGGYCFEQNLLMHDVLVQLGYTVTPLAARVIAGVAEDAPPTPVTHRFTVVDLPEGSFIVDVGFGSKCPSHPITLAPDVETVTPHNTYRVIPYGIGFELQFKMAGGWGGLYRFTNEPRYAADYELSNWYTSTHPNSRFVRNLIVTTVDETRRYNLLNRELTIWHEADRPEARRLETPRDLEAVLVETMKLDLPVPIQTIWEKLPQT
jgi:N-hydroxyarylamine O-acetyltransferase